MTIPSSTGIGDDSGNTLTLGPGFTIDASGSGDFLGSRDLGNTTDGGDTLNNQGVIIVGGGTLTIDYGTLDNTGSIDVSGGATLFLGGTVTTSELDGIVNNGGTIGISGTYDLGGGTLAVGTGTTFDPLVLSGTILDGTIVDNGSGMIFQGGTLSGVTYEGNPDADGRRSVVIHRERTDPGGSGREHTGHHRSVGRQFPTRSPCWATARWTTRR